MQSRSLTRTSGGINFGSGGISGLGISGPALVATAEITGAPAQDAKNRCGESTISAPVVGPQFAPVLFTGAEPAPQINPYSCWGFCSLRRCAGNFYLPPNEKIKRQRNNRGWNNREREKRYKKGKVTGAAAQEALTF
jgi:hypothetical protein